MLVANVVLVDSSFISRGNLKLFSLGKEHFLDIQAIKAYCNTVRIGNIYILVYGLKHIFLKGFQDISIVFFRFIMKSYIVLHFKTNYISIKGKEPIIETAS